MGDKDVDSIGNEEATKWDPTFTEQIKNWVGPLIKRYFRAEVHGLDAIPPAGGALLVSNHSGGMFTPDVLVFAPAFYDKFGFDRPVYTLAHYGDLRRADGRLAAPRRASSRRAGRTPRRRCAPARSCWCSPAATTTHTGRPSRTRSTSPAGPDMSGPLSKPGCRSCRWCRSARRRSQLFLTRGNWLAKRLGLKRLRAEILPVTFGFPFGLQRVLPAQHAPADQDRHAGARPDRRRRSSSARTPTSTRSTPTFAR